MMPALVLKKMVMGNFDKGIVDAEIADSIDFMVQSVRNGLCLFWCVHHLHVC